MSSSTRPSRTEIAEGLGALFVIAVGLLGIPLLLATIVGWPLPHHLPTTGQLHSAAGSQIPDDVLAQGARGDRMAGLGVLRVLAPHRHDRCDPEPPPRDMAPSRWKNVDGSTGLRRDCPRIHPRIGRGPPNHPDGSRHCCS